MLQDFTRKAECPHCTFRFEVPDSDFELNEEFECPQCSGWLRVSSVSPLEFGEYDPWARRPLYVWEVGLVTKGLKAVVGNPDGFSVLPDIAHKQGCREVTLRVKFLNRGDALGTVEVLEVR